MSVKQIRNYIRINDRIATSGQPEELDFRLIAEAGYEVVINLAMPNSDDAIPEESYFVTARGMRYVQIPVPFEAPDVGHLDDFIGVMRGFESRKIWVHCVLNYRVSAFMYHYLQRVEGWDQQKALGAMWPDWEPDTVWKAFMSLQEQGGR
ncbi:MAG: protein tyrosine phosphatase family protein [bacterium]